MDSWCFVLFWYDNSSQCKPMLYYSGVTSLPLRKSYNCPSGSKVTLSRHHNEQDGISNHQCLDCLLNCLFRPRSKKTSKLCFTGLCEGNSPVTNEFPSQRASNVENIPIWWCHHGYGQYGPVANHKNTREKSQCGFLDECYFLIDIMYWRHQVITWTNVDLSSVRSSGNHLMVMSQYIPQPSVTEICLKTTYLKFH